MADLRGRHAIVTGGGRGIGAAVAGALARSGARVTIMGRTAATLAQCARALEAVGEVQAIEVDVTDAQSIAAAFERGVAAFGPAAILVNNAGQAESAPFSKTDVQLWRRMLDVNLTGAFLATQAALPGMLQGGWGRVVNVASTAGLVGYPYVSAYCASKHGLVGLTRALALELARKPITVNAVCPGFTDTDMVREAVERISEATGRSSAQARSELEGGNPQGRLVRPEEVANTVMWLCLPGSESVTGQAISVSGGEVT